MTAVDVDALDKLREALAAGVGGQIPCGHVWNLDKALEPLLPVVDRIATERAAAELEAAAEELDDIAAHLDPQQRSVGAPRGYRLAAHQNRSITAALRASNGEGTT